jgi:gamma-glutamylputrescine oxidase
MHNPDPISWYRESAQPPQVSPKLQGSVEVDVCIVGAGVTGLSAAIELRRLGLSVVVLEAKTIGFGASGRNGGQVAIGQRRSQKSLEDWFGLAKAQELWKVGLDSVNLVERLISQFQIECELKRGSLFLAASPRLSDELKAEVEHLQKYYHHDSLSYLSPREVSIETSALGVADGIKDSRALHLHPLKYVQGLAAAARSLGAVIYESTPLQRINKIASRVSLDTPNGNVSAYKLIVACNAYLDKLYPKISSSIMPINNFMIATEPLDQDTARSITRSDLALSDSQFVVNYWKLSADNRLLFGGGETYREQFPQDIEALVRPYLLQRYPHLAGAKITHAWGGRLAITRNRLPHVGYLNDQIYFAHGFSGHGLSMGTYSGCAIARAIGGDSEMLKPLMELNTKDFPGGRALRWPMMAAGMLYYSLRDKLTPKVRSLV